MNPQIRPTKTEVIINVPVFFTPITKIITLIFLSSHFYTFPYSFITFPSYFANFIYSNCLYSYVLPCHYIFIFFLIDLKKPPKCSYTLDSSLLYLYRARNKITQLSTPTHAQFQRHRLKFIKNHLKNSYMFRSSTIFRELQCPR